MESNDIRLRMPAEWEEQEAVLVAYPDENTDWSDILAEARHQFSVLVATMARNGERVVVVASDAKDAERRLLDWFRNELGDASAMKRVTVTECPINDTWIRDYGPLCVCDVSDGSVSALDFGFNAWGLKFAADKDNLVNGRLRCARVITGSAYSDNRDLILEGGSVESDGEGTLLTTSRCLLSDNRNFGMTRDMIEEELKRRLGFKRILWLEHGHLIGDDTDSHIDTLCRFAPGNVILYTGAGMHGDPQHDELEKMKEELMALRTAEGTPYHLVELPVPDPVYGTDGARLAAGYANYLVTPGHVYMPSYAQPHKDSLAQMTLQSVYPDRNVVPIDCRTLITQGGSLHCSTMQLYPGVLDPDFLSNNKDV